MVVRRTFKPRGRPFQKGRSGNPAGRKKGVPNVATRVGRELAQELLSDPQYRAVLARRLRTGRVQPAVEAMLWYYAYGKPREEVALKSDQQIRLVTEICRDEQPRCVEDIIE